MNFRKVVRCAALSFLLLHLLPAAAATPPTIVNFTNGLDPTASLPIQIAVGPDGNMWFEDAGIGTIGRITPAGIITQYESPIFNPGFLTLGPDGNFWSTDNRTPALDRITPTDPPLIEQFPLSPGSQPDQIAVGADGNLWFSDLNPAAFAIGRSTIADPPVVTEFSAGLPARTFPEAMIAGPDGNLWFGDSSSSVSPAIGRISPDPAGGPPVITTFQFGGEVTNLTAGPDGNVWFTDSSSAIGRVTPAGVVTRFSQGLGIASSPIGIATGPDGNLWFTTRGCAFCTPVEPPSIGRITPAGVITLFPQNNGPTGEPDWIIAGPDGNMWFTDFGCTPISMATPCNPPAPPLIGRLTIPTDVLSVTLAGSGQVTSALSPTVTIDRGAIACVSSDSASRCSDSFADATTVALTAVAATGSIFKGWSGTGAAAGGCSADPSCAVPLSGNEDSAITANFAPASSARTLSVVASGNGTVLSGPAGIDCGATCSASFAGGTAITLVANPADGFTLAGWIGGGCSGASFCIVALTADTTVTAEFVPSSPSEVVLVSSLLPTSRSVQIGGTATVFATIINASTETAGTSCQIQPATVVPAQFFFQTTDPATNQLAGARNAPVTIAPGGGSQTFVLGFTPSAEIAPTNIAFNFTCANAAAAPSQIGLNTMLLSASAAPTPDIVALSATVGNDGIVDIPGTAGVGAFAVATTNVGAASTITASATVGSANLPAILSICQTATATGQCMAPPAPSVTTAIGANETPSFAVFIQGKGTIAFEPAANRIFVRFQDAGGAIRGSTSVAVRTQ